MREGLLILGDHLPDPLTGNKLSASARHRQFVELAVRGESLGFDSVWLGEHHLCDYVAADEETAKQRWRPHHMQYIEWVTKELIPWGAGANIGDGTAAASSLPIPHYRQLLEGPSICGGPEQVVDRIRAIRDCLDLDLHIAMFDHGGIPESMLHESIDSFGEQVLPHVSS